MPYISKININDTLYDLKCNAKNIIWTSEAGTDVSLDIILNDLVGSKYDPLEFNDLYIHGYESRFTIGETASQYLDKIHFLNDHPYQIQISQTNSNTVTVSLPIFNLDIDKDNKEFILSCSFTGFSTASELYSNIGSWTNRYPSKVYYINCLAEEIVTQSYSGYQSNPRTGYTKCSPTANIFINSGSDPNTVEYRVPMVLSDQGEQNTYLFIVPALAYSRLSSSYWTAITYNNYSGVINNSYAADASAETTIVLDINNNNVINTNDQKIYKYLLDKSSSFTISDYAKMW